MHQCISASVGRGWPYQKKKMHYGLSSLFSPSSCPLLAIPLTIWEPGTVIIVTFSWNIVFTTGIIFLQFPGNPSRLTCTPYARFQSLESAKKILPIVQASWNTWLLITVHIHICAGLFPPPPSMLSQTDCGIGNHYYQHRRQAQLQVCYLSRHMQVRFFYRTFHSCINNHVLNWSTILLLKKLCGGGH